MSIGLPLTNKSGNGVYLAFTGAGGEYLLTVQIPKYVAGYPDKLGFEVLRVLDRPHPPAIGTHCIINEGQYNFWLFALFRPMSGIFCCTLIAPSLLLSVAVLVGQLVIEALLRLRSRWKSSQGASSRHFEVVVKEKKI